ncbi:hypothetical protein BDW62DRAFT_175110 [Aspergillus aurantiobrunneus]
MLFAKSTALVALFALGKVVAAAGTGTPACLLNVVGPENPGNLKAICKTNGDEIQSSIRDVCGDEAQDALKFYGNVCKDGGFEVDTESSSTSTSSSSSSTSTSGSSTSTGGASSTGGSDSDSGSGSGSESASTTESAEEGAPTNGASSDKQVSATAFAAVVFLGFAATL